MSTLAAPRSCLSCTGDLLLPMEIRFVGQQIFHLRFISWGLESSWRAEGAIATERVAMRQCLQRAPRRHFPQFVAARRAVRRSRSGKPALAAVRARKSLWKLLRLGQVR